MSPVRSAAASSAAVICTWAPGTPSRKRCLRDGVELLVAELVTNAITASQITNWIPSVRPWMLSDKTQVLILVWDASPEPPVRKDHDAEAESGRGLLLVEAFSEQWDWYVPQQMKGKVVWCLTPEESR